MDTSKRKRTLVTWTDLTVHDSPHSYYPTVIASYATHELAVADLWKAREEHGWRVNVVDHEVSVIVK